MTPRPGKPAVSAAALVSSKNSGALPTSRGETALAAIIAKTRFAPGVVEDAIAKLVARRLIKVAGGDASQPQASPTVPLQTATAWLARRRDAEALLESRLGRGKALPYVTQLHDCGGERAFAELMGSLAKRLSLIVNADVGRELLALLDR